MANRRLILKVVNSLRTWSFSFRKPALNTPCFNSNEQSSLPYKTRKCDKSERQTHEKEGRAEREEQRGKRR